ncbi:hypothetical protein ACHAWF_018342 [Thalassiosira exigua]
METSNSSSTSNTLFFDDAVVGTALVGAVTAAAAIGWRRFVARGEDTSNSSKFESSASSTTAKVVVNSFEQNSASQGTAPITTLTWLEKNNNGNEDLNNDDDIHYLIRSRVRNILQCNPWLTGRFAKQKTTNLWAMEYDSSKERAIKDEDVDRLLVSNNSNKSSTSIHVNSPMDQLNELLLQDNLVLKFRDDIGQPFWRVAVVPDSNNKQRVAIVESLSHAVGDGHTFYELHNMLLGGTSIRALHAERLTTTTELATKAMGGVGVEAQMTTNGGFIAAMIRGVIMTKLIGTKRYIASSRFFLVDMDKIHEIKKQHQQSASSDMAPFVSTNDIITSWYLTNCRNEHGLMAINWRGRLEGHTDEHAGNYEGLIYYRLPQDTNQPRLIRQSISCDNNFRRAVTTDQPIVSRQFAFQTFALVSNWTTFICDTIDLNGYHQLCHIPIYNCAEVLPSTLSTCVIFQATPGQVAVLVGGLDDTMKGLAQCEFESNRPFSSLFE